MKTPSNLPAVSEEIENLTPSSTVEEVTQAFLNLYNINYTNGTEVIDHVRELFTSNVVDSKKEALGNFYRQYAQYEMELKDGHIPALMIEDFFLSGYAGMLRIFTNDCTYLWLVFLYDRSGENWEKPKLNFIGAAISSYDQPTAEEREFPVPFEEDLRFLKKDVPSILFETNLNTGINVSYEEKMFDGIFNCMHVKVIVEGQEAGYYFSY